MSASRGWGWLGLLALALFVGGMTLGGFLASASGLPGAVGALIGAGAGFLVAGWALRKAAVHRVSLPFFDVWPARSPEQLGGATRPREGCLAAAAPRL